MGNKEEKFKEIIESCHLNFLIGSGASTPFFKTLGEIEKYLFEISALKETKLKKIVLSSILKYYFYNCIKDNVYILQKNLSANVTYNHYKVFLNSLNNILLCRKDKLVSKQVNLFTPNIDIFLEMALENEGIEFNDGFMGRMRPTFSLSNYRKTIYKRSLHYDYSSETPLFNLYKLHGSVNWKNENNIVEIDNKLDILIDLENLCLSKNKFVDLYDINNNIKDLDQLYKEAELIKFNNVHTEFVRLYNQLSIINPTKEKFRITTLDNIYYELLRMYSNELEKENSVLFVFGFSFADEHIRDITIRAANSNPTLKICIFAYDENAEDNIKAELARSNALSYNNIYYYERESNSKFNLAKINEKYFAHISEELLTRLKKLN